MACWWPVDYSACGGEPDDDMDVFETMAGDLLKAWTGHQYGVCEAWYEGEGGCGTRPCGCQPGYEIRLPGPVHRVKTVKIDDVLVAGWQVDGNRLLRDRPWPRCGVVVEYLRGRRVPKGGRIAAGVLAKELYKAACNDDECQLPQRIQSVTRQGVTVEMYDDFSGLEDGKTGLWLVDAWIASERPENTYAGRVRSPDARWTA